MSPNDAHDPEKWNRFSEEIMRKRTISFPYQAAAAKAMRRRT
jgi:hypothetical protein